jgi:hypothetical protein
MKHTRYSKEIIQEIRHMRALGLKDRFIVHQNTKARPEKGHKREFPCAGKGQP